MSQEGNVSEQLSALSKKIEDQSRFTRVLVLMCTSAIAAIMFYLTTEVVSSLPMLQLSVDQLQAIYAKKTGTAVGVPAPPSK
ncbi:MAG: hypothetical protein K2Y22_02835 [Candidatus Obscuribacterales bacterium]|nr:hypothetical protein [Candidatus Obscuribacterales bacterium]